MGKIYPSKIIKIAIDFFLGHHEGFPSFMRSLKLSRVNVKIFKKLLHSFLFVGLFRCAFMNPDLDPTS
jgi:hypothetical protein